MTPKCLKVLALPFEVNHIPFLQTTGFHKVSFPFCHGHMHLFKGNKIHLRLGYPISTLRLAWICCEAIVKIVANSPSGEVGPSKYQPGTEKQLCWQILKLS